MGFCSSLISLRGCIAFDQVMMNTENTKKAIIHSYKVKLSFSWELAEGGQDSLVNATFGSCKKSS